LFICRSGAAETIEAALPAAFEEKEKLIVLRQRFSRQSALVD
jgi:hypothetical protein